MLQWVCMAKARSDIWGQARPCVSGEVEALTAAKAEVAMAELLVEEAKPGGAAGSAGGSSGKGPAMGCKGKGWSGGGK